MPVINLVFYLRRERNGAPANYAPIAPGQRPPIYATQNANHLIFLSYNSRLCAIKQVQWRRINTILLLAEVIR